MKRHQQLQELSREHHNALKLALHAKRAALSGDHAQISASASACVDAFGLELNPHFVAEETALLPALLKEGEQDLVRRTLSEHEAMRALVRQLAQPSATILLDFAELLTAHVRFEERELFEVAQQHLERQTPL